MEIDVRGDIIGNDDKWIYDWLEWDSTCPDDVKSALQTMPAGEKLIVNINSGGGSVMAGQEIYSLLHGRKDVEIHIQSLAGSAASVIAMANTCKMSPVATIMIHNVSMSGASGDYHDMQKNAEILKTMNSALAEAYIAKTGKTKDEILKMMDKETWITAGQALEMGFVDEVEELQTQITNSICGIRLTEEIRQQVTKEKELQNKKEQLKNELLNDLDKYGV
ncbi:MAG: Clp protease ClpP [Anaerobutyricum hallii]|uniref:head maturation protease, ClpP-related n=1 Tax=Anaerobutyricum hallii TaxID=39488 RepID=UPI002A818E6A|nr:head maturation protease, ClpP-related [Anaerobutyricum hallii]MDY4579797.1 Clp protease ClpP [Anaerobutyricum hallii]